MISLKTLHGFMQMVDAILAHISDTEGTSRKGMQTIPLPSKSARKRALYIQ